MELIAISLNEFKNLQTKVDELFKLIASKEIQSNPNRLITNEELVRAYKISKETAKKWRQRNFLPFIKVGRKIFYDEAEVIKCFKNHSLASFRSKHKSGN